MSGSLVGGVVGAVIGFVASGFNPMGAYYGFVAGSMLGGMLFPPDGPSIKGPRIEELRVQDSAYGKAIPKIYGTFRLSGNVIWLGEIIEKKKKKKSGGKGGGGGATTTTYTYYANFAVALCQGEIQGIRRIWANNKLIYDLSVDADAKTMAASIALIDSTMQVYQGTETQLPDPTIEAEEGAGNVPAHRGLAYVVFKNFNLTNYGNYIPQLSFEVVERGDTIVKQGIIGEWVYPTELGTMFGGNKVSASGGYVAGLGYYYGYNGVSVRKVTQNGLKMAGGFGMPGDGLNGLFPAMGYSDDDGMLGRYSVDSSVKQAWISLPKGSVRITGIPGFWIANLYTNFVKENGVIWATSSMGLLDVPIYRDDGQTTINSVDLGPFAILGVSASYLYAVKVLDGELRRYDKITLEYVDTLLVDSRLISNSTGYVVDDTLMYFTGAGIYKIEFPSGTITRLTDRAADELSFSAITLRAVSEDVLTYSFSRGGDTLKVASAWNAFGDSFVPLSEIIADVCQLAGLTPSQYDVSGVTDLVRGFAITSLTSAKDALYTLLKVHFIDVADSGGKLTFVRRGGAVKGTFDAADFIADDAPPLTQTKLLDTEIPAEASISYASVEFDQQLGTQRSVRQSTKSQQKESVNVPVVFTDGEARLRSEVMLSVAVVGKQTFAFKTPRNYLKYEPTDLVVISDRDDSETYLVRLLSKDLSADGIISWTAKLEDTSLYLDGTESPAIGASSLSPKQTLPYVGPSELMIIDTPPLRDEDTTPAVYLAAAGYAATWPGCVVEMSRDGGESWNEVTAMLDDSTLGYTTSVLGPFAGGNIPDELNTLTVELINGELTSTTFDGLLSGVNAACVGNELIFFRDAVEVSPLVYELSGFLRGRRGTERAMSTHALNEKFVLLSADTLYRMTVKKSDLGDTLDFFTTTIGLTTEGSTENFSEPIDEACVMPLAPVLFVAGHGSASSASDITLKWVRQARVNTDWTSGSDVPLDQTTEIYQVTISSATDVARTLTVKAAQTYIYTASQISSDGFLTGDTITFSVAQKSDLGFYGHEAVTSLTR